MLKVSVIIPVFNEESRIGLCLERLSKQQILPYQVIIVDNASTDGSSGIIQGFIETHPDMNFILLNEMKKGISSARNKGLQHADGDIIAFTDADCLPQEDWIKNMIELHKTDEIDGIGGVVYIHNPITCLEKVQTLEMAVQRQFRQSIIDNEYNVFLGKFIMGCNASYKRGVFQQLKGWDEFYNNFAGEDVDLSIRAFKKGFNLIAWHPELVVYHLPRKNLKLYLKKIFMYAQSLPLIFKKHYKNEMLIQLPAAGMRRVPFFTSAVITKYFLFHIFYVIMIVIFSRYFVLILLVAFAVSLINSSITVFKTKNIINSRISFFEFLNIIVILYPVKLTWIYGKIYGSIKNRLIYL